jgi:small subunit ribosomal protein S2
MLTNWTTVQTRVAYLKKLDAKEESGELDLLPKKEAALLRREHEKLRQNLEGLKEMTQLPDIVVIIDPKRENTAVLECRKLGIPIIAILDTNCDPNLVDIPIPANDDAVKSIKLILSKIADGITVGKNSIK